MRLGRTLKQFFEFATKLRNVRTRCNVGKEILSNHFLGITPGQRRFPLVVNLDDTLAIEADHAERHCIEFRGGELREVLGCEALDLAGHGYRATTASVV